MESAAPEISFEYPDEAMAAWEALWGVDFISPGGAEEVRQIVKGEDLADKTILEVGSGWGGPSLLFAQEYHAAKVVGIDLQQKAVDKANSRVADLKLTHLVEFRAVNSLCWPFPDASFDVVFSKDALLHTEDKEAVYAEIKRVLKPGGHLIYADWFGCDQPPTPDLLKWLEENKFTMALKSLGSTVDLFIRLGFEEMRVKDRCEWFKAMFKRDVETLQGSVGEQLAQGHGADRIKDLTAKWFEPCAVLAEQGQLRLGTFYATKPLR